MLDSLIIQLIYNIKKKRGINCYPRLSDIQSKNQIYRIACHFFFLFPLNTHARIFSVGPLTDTPGSLSSIMFSSICAQLLSQAAGVLFCPIRKGLPKIQRSYLSLSISELGMFSLKVKLKRYARKESVSAIQNTFFYQTGDILPTKYCQMLANSTYFSYPAP